MEDLIFPANNIGILTQLLVAMLLGMLLGAERTIAGKSAGMRTYALISMGSALFIIISTTVSSTYLGVVNFDPLRVTAAIITGIGFIGAGIIIFRETTLRGLTTAAGMWIAAGVGVAIGFQLYLLAIFAAVLTLFVFTAMWFVEEHFEERLQRFGLGKPSSREESMEDDREEN